ncbi:MAG: hypothetical protein ABR956_06875, partial [Terracidiphilus sp.]
MRLMKALHPCKRRWPSGLGSEALRSGLQLLLAASLGLFVTGCSSGSSTAGNPAPPANPSQLYFAPTMGDDYQATYAIDHTANTFVRSVDYTENSTADGLTITDSGGISPLSNGIVSLGETYHNSLNGSTSVYNPAQTGNWAVELPGQAALIGMADYTNFTPAVPTGACPGIATAETLQFVTIPNRLSSSSTAITPNKWDWQLETAYGSVTIATTGTTVQFSNIVQNTFPVNGAPGTPANPGQGSVTAACAPTFFGQTISVPGSVTVQNPGTQETVPPSATIGIGPSGFLVEDAGSSQIQGQTYENILGAGFGAIGLPMPSGALTTSTVAATQYQGFLYGSGGAV